MFNIPKLANIPVSYNCDSKFSPTEHILVHFYSSYDIMTNLKNDIRFNNLVQNKTIDMMVEGHDEATPEDKNLLPPQSPR